MKIFVKILLTTIFFLSIFDISHISDASSFARPDYMAVDQGKPIQEQRESIEISGKKLNIPLAYIQSHSSDGETHQSVLLEVLFPDMKSLYDLNNHQEYEQMRTQGRIGWILLENANVRPPLSLQIQLVERGLFKKEFVKKIGNFEEYTYYHRIKQDIVPWSEMYIEKNSNAVITYIDCPTKIIAKFPTCRGKFLDKGLIYDISFDERNYFSKWTFLKLRAIKFIDSFRSGTTEGEK